MSSRTKVVMIGTGTPNTDPRRSGPCVAVVVDETAYLVDCGPGVVRRCTQAYHMGIEGLKSENLKHCFVTHLHSDHTGGLSDLILMPWVMVRNQPLKMIGPKGLSHMVSCIKEAYKADINERITGFEQANKDGIKVEVTEIEDNGGIVYQDDLVKVEAIQVVHGTFEGSFGFKFTTPDKVVVISGDTNPCEALIEAAKGCDILVHEVYYADGLAQRADHWQKYHSTLHTSSKELGIIANRVEPKTLVLYHHLYHFDINTYTPDLYEKTDAIDKIMMEDVKANFKGRVISANDLDVFE